MILCLIFTAISGFKASAATEPGISLQYVAYGRMDYYTDSQGKILLSSLTGYNAKSAIIDNGGMQNTVAFQVTNAGSVINNNVIIEFRFNKIAMKLKNSDYFTCDLIYPVARGSNFTFDFSNAVVSPGASIDVYIAAEGSIVKKFSIPVYVSKYN